MQNEDKNQKIAESRMFLTTRHLRMCKHLLFTGIVGI